MNRGTVGRLAAAIIIAVTSVAGLVACTSDADVVNENLNKDADNFKVLRKVVFYNAILDKYILSVEGYCSVDPGDGNRMTVTCKSGKTYFRNALGKSDNVLWWYEQLENSAVSPDHYKIVMKPETIIPQPEIR